MFCLKFFKIHLIFISYIIFFNICGCIFIELVYCRPVESIVISYSNIYAISEVDFQISSFKAIQRGVQGTQKIYYSKLLERIFQKIYE